MLKSIIHDYMKDKKLKYSICIKDLKTGEACCINEKEVVSSASIIKLFIMGKAFELAGIGKLNLDDRILIDKRNRVPYSIIYVLDDKNTYTIKDLITLMIIQSDNTATNQLIDMLGMEIINEFIIDLGFKHTVLRRKMMDIEARAAGRDNYTTAQEVAEYLELLYNGQLINREYSDKMLDIMKLQLDNSMMRVNIPEEIVIAHKTGNLTNINHDAGIVYTEDKNYIFTMMTFDAVSDNYARNVIGEVSKITYDYFLSGTKETFCHD